IGEYVQQGTIIAYVGSSGCSSDAHLHFEPGNYVSSVWVNRDPWNGTFNTLPSLWASQKVYAGGVNFQAHDMGVYVNASVGGDVNTTTYAQLKERVIDPVTVGNTENEIGVWVLA